MDQTFQPKKINIAYISAGWHSEIVGQCRAGFEDELARHNSLDTDLEAFAVPGSFDIPLLAKHLAMTGRFDAIVAAGFVVDGGIYRHDFVASAVIDGLMRVQLDTDVPVISVVLTPHQFQEHEPHINFFRDHFFTKGKEAADACLKIVNNLALIARTNVA
ncbi:MAG: 6,7-dimethyl-8-ribityllumazine synthase [Rhodospirillales bacterium]|nr:6,7-dimethyl-8-ribityllumazine synthase [Rhodospirillales bacterium]